MKKQDNERANPTGKTLRFGLGATLLLMMLSALGYGWRFDFAPSNEPEAWAQFGDFFAGIWGPLLSFLTFAFLLITLRWSLSATKAAEASADAARQQLALARDQLHQERVGAELRDLILALEKYDDALYKLVEEAHREVSIENGIARLPEHQARALSKHNSRFGGIES
jgi:hypothetical protein